MAFQSLRRIGADRAGSLMTPAGSGCLSPIPRVFARDIAQSVRRLAEDPALRSRYGQRARDKVLREGLWSSKAGKLVDLYKDVLASQKAPQHIQRDR